VDWLKGETLEANLPPDSTGPPPTSSDGETPSILSTLLPFLFPDLTEHLAAPSLGETYLQFREELGFGNLGRRDCEGGGRSEGLAGF